MKNEGEQQKKQNNVAYLKECPTYRAVFGVMEMILGFALIAAAVITIAGISKYDAKEFFHRMGNTIRSFSSDYYDIRSEEFDYDTILIGGGSLKTSPNVRSAAACLKLDDSKQVIMPGSFGTTTFYIIPKDTDKDITAEIEFNVCGISKADNGEYVKLSETGSVSGIKADELLDGHILFFTDYNGTYSGLLKDGKLTYNTADHRSDLNNNGEYKVTVYWIWAEYYEQLVDMAADGALISENAESIEIKHYIEERQDKFFCDGEAPSEDPSQRYNNGDLFIHQNVDYYGFEIKALN